MGLFATRFLHSWMSIKYWKLYPLTHYGNNETVHNMKTRQIKETETGLKTRRGFCLLQAPGEIEAVSPALPPPPPARPSPRLPPPGPPPASPRPAPGRLYRRPRGYRRAKRSPMPCRVTTITSGCTSDKGQGRGVLGGFRGAGGPPVLTLWPHVTLMGSRSGGERVRLIGCEGCRLEENFVFIVCPTCLEYSPLRTASKSAASKIPGISYNIVVHL